MGIKTTSSIIIKRHSIKVAAATASSIIPPAKNPFQTTILDETLAHDLGSVGMINRLHKQFNRPLPAIMTGILDNGNWAKFTGHVGGLRQSSGKMDISSMHYAELVARLYEVQKSVRAKGTLGDKTHRLGNLYAFSSPSEHLLRQRFGSCYTVEINTAASPDGTMFSVHRLNSEMFALHLHVDGNYSFKVRHDDMKAGIDRKLVEVYLSTMLASPEDFITLLTNPKLMPY